MKQEVNKTMEVMLDVISDIAGSWLLTYITIFGFSSGFFDLCTFKWTWKIAYRTPLNCTLLVLITSKWKASLWSCT